MQITELQDRLKQSYNLLDIVDIAKLVVDQKAVYDYFRSVHQAKYADSDRIVLFSSYEPSDLILEHIQKASVVTDISSYFIVICTPYDLQTRLDQIAVKHNQSPIKSFKIDITDSDDLTDDNIISLDNFCPAPWTSLLLTPAVDVDTGHTLNPVMAAPCCKIDQAKFVRDTDCNVTANSVETAINSKSFNYIRDQFKKNTKPIECNNCWKVEESGGASLRQHYLSEGDDDFLVTKITPQYLQLNPGITCNFKCRICHHATSSSIAMEEIQHSDNPEFVQILSDRIKRHSLVDVELYKKVLGPCLADLKELHIFGGEPTLMKNLVEVFEYISDQGHSEHISIMLSTNGSTWSQSLVSALKPFKQVDIHISIDNVGQRFEIERGGDWNEVTEIINRWIALPDENFNVAFGSTISIQNVFYLDELISYADSLGIDIAWVYVDVPTELCIDNITATAKKLIYDKFNNHPNSELDAIAQRVMATEPVSGEQFINLMDLYDLRRGTHFNKTHKEIYDAMLAK